MTAIVVAVIVASGVVAIGVVTGEDDPEISADPGSADSPSPTPEVAGPETGPPEETAEPEDESTGDEAPEPTAEPTEMPEVTDVELTVDRPEYTGRCPVTLEFSARITTNTGPVKAQYSWLDVDSHEASGDSVQFGGPGPQGVTVTHEVEVADSVTLQRTIDITAPNGVTSEPVEATVTCTPYAEVTKGGDDFSTEPPPCRHVLHFEATITVPNDMTVTYTWLRSDGALDGGGPYIVEFTGGGTQTKAVPGKEWTLSAEGDFGYRLQILTPFEVTSDAATYEAVDCSGPAS